MYLSTPVPFASASRGLPTTTPISIAAGLTFLLNEEHGNNPNSPAGGWSSLIGIVTAICGNVLISFALNTQRYAHIRLSRDRSRAREAARKAESIARRGHGGRYGTQDASGSSNGTWKFDGTAEAVRDGEEEVEGMDELETDPLISGKRTRTVSSSSDETIRANEKNEDDESQKSYLRSPIWWLGIGMMTIGEAGNFLAYGFAPASIVSPMGVVALVSNCLIAPLLLGEQFRWRDAAGVIIAVGGCVTVVLSASDSNPKLTPESIWHLITRWEFETYFGITAFLIIALMMASNRYGDRSVLIDVGLVGLFGGFTALSTKGIASLLSNTIWRVVTFPITYLLLVVLVFTAVMQIKYINRALQRFNATVVIPTQFVLFTLSVIMGSAILYRDFEREEASDGAKFVGGCALTFLGVWCITSGRSETGFGGDSDEENDEEGIRLVDEESLGLETQDIAFVASRKSSKTSGTSHSSPALSRHRTIDTIPPSLLVTSEGDEEQSQGQLSDLGPANLAAIHSDSLASISPTNSDEPMPPALHATTSLPTVLTTADFSPANLRPATPMNRNASVPSQPSPATTGKRPQTSGSSAFLDLNGNDSPLAGVNNLDRLHPRASVGALSLGPLTSPLSGSLSAIVADSLRRGVDSSPASTLKRRRSSKTGNTLSQRRRTGTLNGESGLVPFTSRLPMSGRGNEVESEPANEPESPSVRRHSRSLSAALGELFSDGRGSGSASNRRADE
ncbi:putative magnesium transporter nipa6 [Acrodontium crateriforme]|uniref:Magnesium transporter nipa6 n=1 Tax=Acrodontium crateriforme TaxID=150365 RepID=A0AAQ3LWJ8_9PEZI|nr:putative magnesium transporter nipa6 [Acrodontium crateriforme]